MTQVARSLYLLPDCSVSDNYFPNRCHLREIGKRRPGPQIAAYRFRQAVRFERSAPSVWADGAYFYGGTGGLQPTLKELLSKTKSI